MIVKFFDFSSRCLKREEKLMKLRVKKKVTEFSTQFEFREIEYSFLLCIPENNDAKL